MLWIAYSIAAATILALDTLKLIQDFGIPDSKHLVIDTIIASVGSADLINLLWDTQLVVRVVTQPDGPLQNNLVFRTGAAVIVQLTDLDIHIRNDLQIAAPTNSPVLSFGHHFETGTMLIQDDLNLEEITQVTTQRSVSNPYFQVGNRRKVNQDFT